MPSLALAFGSYAVFYVVNYMFAFVVVNKNQKGVGECLGNDSTERDLYSKVHSLISKCFSFSSYA